MTMSEPLKLPKVPDSYFLESVRKTVEESLRSSFKNTIGSLLPPDTKDQFLNTIIKLPVPAEHIVMKLPSTALVIYDEAFAADQLERLMRAGPHVDEPGFVMDPDHVARALELGRKRFITPNETSIRAIHAGPFNPCGEIPLPGTKSPITFKPIIFQRTEFPSMPVTDTVALQIDELRTIRECASRNMLTDEHKATFADAANWDRANNPELAALYQEIQDKFGELFT